MRWLLLALLAGCGAPRAEPADAAVPLDLTVTRGPHEHATGPLVENQGGPILATPSVYTITWRDDADAGARFEAFTRAYLASDSFVQPIAEYGVGAGSSSGLVLIDEDAPSTLDTGRFVALVEQLAATHPAGVGTIYSFVVPTKTQVLQEGSSVPFCGAGLGYHDLTSAGHVFAVTVDCGGGFDGQTVTLSHELVEASTDPHPLTGPAFQSLHPPGELADLCFGSAQVMLDEGDAGATYAVTRVYSNTVAKAGNADPCLPAPADQPYFGAAADPVTVAVALDAHGYGEADFAIDLFSFGDSPTIRWSILDTPGFTFTPKKGSGAPGDVVQVHVVAEGAQQGLYDTLLYVTARSGDATTYWTASLHLQ